MNKVAILGASGFVGSRMVEMFHLGRLMEVHPIVRSFTSLPRIARFDLDWRVADACSEEGLTKAFEDCDSVVHVALGTPNVIENSVVAAYRAASKAGVRRLVYLSTASVHGQSPTPGTNEGTALSDRQPLEYNNCKVRAEGLLQRERGNGNVEVVIIRPGIVFGPRDRWISTLATELLSGSAYLVSQGSGICNSIYVDNLVHAIQLALTTDKVDGEAFLVGDSDTVIWAELYMYIAKGLGIPFSEIHQLPPPVFSKTWRDHIAGVRNHPATQAALPLIPGKAKRVVKAAFAALPDLMPSSPWVLPRQSPPAATREMAELHQCRWKLPLDKAQRILKYEPPVSFEEGCQRSLQWLAFAGYKLPKQQLDNLSECIPPSYRTSQA